MTLDRGVVLVGPGRRAAVGLVLVVEGFPQADGTSSPDEVVRPCVGLDLHVRGRRKGRATENIDLFLILRRRHRQDTK